MDKNATKRSWFREHRDYFVTRVVQDFLKTGDVLKNLESAYKEKRPIYAHLHELVGEPQEKGVLWRLKDRCHQIWRNEGMGKEAESFFFDWMIGAMFHEAMKLKENSYMLERYAPSYEIALRELIDEEESENCRRFFRETVRDMARGMERIKCLFRNAAARLRHLVRQEKGNGILIRLLLEESDQVEEYLSSDDGPLLIWLFPDGVHNAFLVAGESYLEGGWYAEARLAFEEALRIKPDCREAQNGLSILEKRLKDMALYGPAYLIHEWGLNGGNSTHDLVR